MAFGLGLQPQPHIRSWPKSAATACTAAKPLEAANQPQNSSHVTDRKWPEVRPQASIRFKSTSNPLQSTTPINLRGQSDLQGHEPALQRVSNSRKSAIRGRFWPYNSQSVVQNMAGPSQTKRQLSIFPTKTWPSQAKQNSSFRFFQPKHDQAKPNKTSAFDFSNQNMAEPSQTRRQLSIFPTKTQAGQAKRFKTFQTFFGTQANFWSVFCLKYVAQGCTQQKNAAQRRFDEESSPKWAHQRKISASIGSQTEENQRIDQNQPNPPFSGLIGQEVSKNLRFKVGRPW
jgi:hypothetical protein